MSDPKQQKTARRRRAVRLAVVALSLGAGVLCGFLPEEYRAACRLAAKVVAFFGGG